MTIKRIAATVDVDASALPAAWASKEGGVNVSAVLAIVSAAASLAEVLIKENRDATEAEVKAALSRAGVAEAQWAEARKAVTA